jgi:hypothetical protein
MYISDIVWPNSHDERIELILSFMVDVIQNTDFDSSRELQESLSIANDFLNNEIDVEIYEHRRIFEWSKIDSMDAWRDFETRSVLESRLSICLLSANVGIDEPAEKIGFFFEVLDYMNVNTDYAEDKMKTHFLFGN